MGNDVELWEENKISREVKRESYERVVIPTVVYVSETWSLSEQERRHIEVFEMMCLSNICGVRRVDRVRNAITRERCECELSVLERIERKVLKLFEYVERMGEKLVKREYQENLEGNRGRGRPQNRWMDEMKDLLMRRGLCEKDGMMLARDRNVWVGKVCRSK